MSITTFLVYKCLVSKKYEMMIIYNRKGFFYFRLYTMGLAEELLDGCQLLR